MKDKELQNYFDVFGIGMNGPIVSSLSWMLEGYLHRLDEDIFTYVTGKSLKECKRILKKSRHPYLLERGILKNSVGDREVIAEVNSRTNPNKVHEVYIGNLPFTTDLRELCTDKFNNLTFSCSCGEFIRWKICADFAHNQKIYRSADYIRKRFNIPSTVKIYQNPLCPDLHAVFAELSSTIGMFTPFNYQSQNTVKLARLYFNLRHEKGLRYADVEKELKSVLNSKIINTNNLL